MAKRTRPRASTQVQASPGIGAYERIWAAIVRIPHGRVATYGQIASLVGLGRQARRVGYALAALPDDREVPWHRVVNAAGRVSARANPFHESVQRGLLEAEGVRFDESGRIDLDRFRWRGRAVRSE